VAGNTEMDVGRPMTRRFNRPLNMYATIEGSSRKGNMNNNSLPELKAFTRAPCLGLSQWENGNLTTNRAQLVDS
jgi:hypothetical protein